MLLSIVLLIILFMPEYAYAWGPATHLELGWDILNNLKLLTPHARELLSGFPYDYLYGNISADIVAAKNLTEELKHCHNWRIGLKVLKEAASPSQKAFAYGYLSHLAADTIAHNYYIPERLLISFSTRLLRHTYWELRFDAMADKKVWKLPKQIAKGVHRDNDKLLDSVLEDTVFSFRTNKTIFSSILLIHRIEQWHRMIALLSYRSKWKLTQEDKNRYHIMSRNAVADFLNNGNKARCMKEDPTGRSKLDNAKNIRKRLKALKWNGGDWEKAVENALQKNLPSNLLHNNI